MPRVLGRKGKLFLVRSRYLALLLAFPVVALAAGVPPNPRRASPPPGIEESAVKVGAVAPTFELEATTGTKVSLKSALERGPAVVVFYRGFW